MPSARRLPVGAEITSTGVHFRVWAPRSSTVEVIDASGAIPPVTLQSEEAGYFAGTVLGASPGFRYRYRLDRDQAYPDPVSRYQPEGPHGPSEVIDPLSFPWTDSDWPGRSIKGQVVYELHIGTFTPEGTYASATRELPALADLGVTVIEMMPIADFPGRFGWGYDGVNLFAPTRLYGPPDDLRRFIDRAHQLGIAVILDVVYNHLGPDGNYLACFAKDYFTDRYKTEWGEPLNFDGEQCRPVREFFLSNAAYWINEFHFDGLRLDATQAIFDASEPHIIAEIGEVVRSAARGRETIIIAENESQHSELARPIDRSGYGLDGLWNDDFHHSAHVALTGRSEAYYSDYLGTAQELLSAVKYGYLYQGQWYSWQKHRRGRPGLDLPAPAFVNFLENHDQVANSARGLRIHALTSPGRFRAMTALFLLAPGTPMLFMGQEFAASAPFNYFADHNPELASLVANGRTEFLKQFATMKDPRMAEIVPPPHELETFNRCKLDLSEREKNAHVLRLTRDLLRLRREEPTLARQDRRLMDGATLSQHALVIRFFDEANDDRLFIVNLGRDLKLDTSPEPLLAPPWGCRWEILFSTEDPAYHGSGTDSPEAEDRGWRIPGESALVLRPVSSPNSHR